MKRLLVILLLLAPVALPGLAHASPPDPAWIQGIYDDDDGDDDRHADRLRGRSRAAGRARPLARSSPR